METSLRSPDALYSALWQADGTKTRRFAPVDSIGRSIADFFGYSIAMPDLDKCRSTEKPVATGNSPWLSSAPELRSRGRDYFPNFAPITSPDTMISTRRFSLRPAAVLLSATGFS